MHLVPRQSSYDACVSAFRWNVPTTFNIAAAVCDRHARSHPDRIALLVEADDGTVTRYTFKHIQERANRLANAFAGLGAGPGDRVAIVLKQGIECLLAHLATYKLGAIAVPLSPLFGRDGLRHRLGDSGTSLVVSSGTGCAEIESIWDELPALRTLLSTDRCDDRGALDFWATLERGAADFITVASAPADPALLVYTSGTTGLAKGALHAHQVLLGHLPGVEFSLGFFPQQDDLYWSPADWSWIAGLLDVVLPSLYHAVPVLVRGFDRFDPEAAFDLMARHAVRNALITPTALRMMRQVATTRWPGLALRSLCSGGEPLGDALLDWGRDALGVTINEVYGQTEANLIVGGNADLMPARAGATGRAIPGHEVAIVNDAGEALGPGALGQIAVRRPDPVVFLEYWKNPAASAQKFAGASAGCGGRSVHRRLPAPPEDVSRTLNTALRRGPWRLS